MNAYVEALYAAMRLSLAAEHDDRAITLLKLVIGAGGDDGYFLYALGNCQFKAKRYAEAVVALRASVRIDPRRAEAFNDLAAALFALGEDAEALTCIRRALDLKPGLAEPEETDGIWLLRYGRFREGWRKYEARFATLANHRLRRGFAQPVWRGEPLLGRTILLHTEQGFGDALQFLRYAPLVAARGGRVVLELYPGIKPLLSRMKGIAAVVERGGALPRFDLHCPLLSLPLAFGTDLDSIPATVPYVSVPEDRMTLWRSRLGPRRGLRVGIAWAGNPHHNDDTRRSIPFDRFSALLAVEADFHVLSPEPRLCDPAALQAMPRLHLHPLRDFADTAALISLMDVVVTVDTSVAHLAGALGWPVWLLLSRLADWRWMLERDDSPWYPSMTLFRQHRKDDWDGVLADVAEQLRALRS